MVAANISGHSNSLMITNSLSHQNNVERYKADICMYIYTQHVCTVHTYVCTVRLMPPHVWRIVYRAWICECVMYFLGKGYLRGLYVWICIYSFVCLVCMLASTHTYICMCLLLGEGLFVVLYVCVWTLVHSFMCIYVPLFVFLSIFACVYLLDYTSY